MRRILSSNVFLFFCILAAFAILVSLGNWQVRRLGEKEALIAEVNSRMKSAPADLASIGKRWAATKDVDYFPLRVSGTYDHTRETLFYNTQDGNVGWHVIVPFELEDGRVMLLNRGFVPDQLRQQEKRKEGLVGGKQEITGLARNPVTERPNSMIPDNSLEKNEFYWKDFNALAEKTGLAGSDKLVPFMVDAGANPDAAFQWPKGGVTRVSFPNNHLQYAVTWYGLATILVLVGGAFMWSRRRR